MADTVTVRTLHDSKRQIVVLMTNVSDSTGETAITKVDKSALVSASGIEPVSLDIERVYASVSGFTHVQLLWDHNTDDQAIILPTGSSVFEFDDKLDDARAPILSDPRSTGGTGDVLLTTAGASATARYTIELWLRKQVT
jgi:hypothetical protein